MLEYDIAEASPVQTFTRKPMPFGGRQTKKKTVALRTYPNKNLTGNKPSKKTTSEIKGYQIIRHWEVQTHLFLIEATQPKYKKQQTRPNPNENDIPELFALEKKTRCKPNIFEKTHLEPERQQTRETHFKNTEPKIFDQNKNYSRVPRQSIESTSSNTRHARGTHRETWTKEQNERRNGTRFYLFVAMRLG